MHIDFRCFTCCLQSEEMGSNLAELFAPGVADYVEALLVQGRVGVCAGTLRIIDIGSSCSSIAEVKSTSPCADRFKLVIPYAGMSLTWEVLFNYLHPEEPPDFIFSPDDKDFDPDITNIQSLVNWNALNAKSLLWVTEEILEQYSRYQQSLIALNSRLQFEYSSLVETRFEPSDIEVHVTMKGQNKFGPVNFLIKLDVDFSKIPAYLTEDDPGEDTAVLCVTFQTPDGGKVSPQLYLSPRVEHSLGGSAGLRIPPFPSGGCLIDYVPTVHELLCNTVNQVVQAYERRQLYIQAFLAEYGRSVLEYDADGFSKISFILEWHDFFFIIIIELPEGFPNELPIFTFNSVYHETAEGRPYCCVVKEYPYSPRWPASEMAKRAKAFILEYIGEFQRASIKDGNL